MRKSPDCILKIVRISLVLGLICHFNLAKAYQIEGNIILPENSDWSPVIYLSLINSFDDLNAISEDFIINKSVISEDGHFILKGENIPESDRIYRLHICQKGDPIATIMIGGEEENHCHFLMNKHSKLVFESSEMLFSNYKISENEGYDFLKNQLKIRKQPPKVNSKTNREFRQKQFEKTLSNFADTSQNSTLSLLALYYLDYENDLSVKPEFYEDLYSKMKSQEENSPYFFEFEQKLFLNGILRQYKSSNWSFWLIGFTILTGVILLFFKNKSQKNKSFSEDKIAQLSNRERRVFELLKAGKTNKEISNELNIGLSTVKSHIHKIYSKLGIKSRKEVRIF